MMTIEHPLVATTFTIKQCQTIMAPILKEALHSVKVQKRLPQVLVYGPTKYQGLGIHDPWTMQLISHLQCILRHCTRFTITGLLHNTNMDNLTLELGSSLPFWQLEYDDWQPIATHSWITKTWRDLQLTPLTIKGPMNIPKARRLQDVFLMEDSFVAMGLEGDDLRLLNDMRMFKQVIRLSDITSADGQVILKSFLDDGSRPTHPSPYRWPRCYKPSASQVNLWQTTLLACYCIHGTKLAHPLSQWLAEDPPESWDWWFSEALNCLLQFQDGTWVKWNSIGIQYQWHRFQSALPSSLTLYPSLQSELLSKSLDSAVAYSLQVLRNPLPLSHNHTPS
jgi:hypothetical protein